MESSVTSEQDRESRHVIPENINFASLVTIDYSKLIATGPITDHESKRLFEAVTATGFFYLDLRKCVSEGESTSPKYDDFDIFGEVKQLFHLMKDFFDLHIEEKLKYDVAKYGGFYG
jgi:isopenicillin N synthase-like dioxygenase